MKNRTTLIILALWAGVALADPPISNNVDIAGSSAPTLDIHTRNIRTYIFKISANATNLNLTAYTPYFYAAPSNTAPRAQMQPATCSWLSSSNGIMQAVFSANQFTSSGAWIYGLGLTDAATNNTTIVQGPFKIKADPH